MAIISPVPKLQFFDANGDPLSGGKLYSYEAGTTTPLATYTDATGLTPNANPVILDSRGEASVWLGTDLYKFMLTTSTDVEIYTVDSVNEAAALSAAGISVTATTFNSATTVQTQFNNLGGNEGSSYVGFLQSGTGAVARSAQSKMREFFHIPDFNGDGNAAATAAFAAQRPLLVERGETAKLTVATTDDLFDACRWLSTCSKYPQTQIQGGGDNLYIELADGGHRVEDYLFLSGPTFTLDLRAATNPAEITITGITYAAVSGNVYRATVNLGSTLHANAVVGMPIGMYNIAGNNDAGAANGGQIVETITGTPGVDATTFTFLFQRPVGAPVSPTTLATAILSFTGGTTSPVFAGGETITGASSGATAAVVRALYNTSTTTSGVLYVRNVSGTFVSGETITGGTSAATASASGTTGLLNTTSMNIALVPRAWVICPHTATPGGSVEGVWNFYNGSRAIMRNFGIAFEGSNSSADDDDDLIAVFDNGSRLYLWDKMVVAGAGDFVIRMFGEAECYINRSCVGGGQDAFGVLSAQSGGFFQTVRAFCGSASDSILTLGSGAGATDNQTILTSGLYGARVNGSGANFAHQTSQIIGCTYGIDALMGDVYTATSTSTRIMDCTNGIRRDDGLGSIFSTPNFNNVGTQFPIRIAHPAIYLGGVTSEYALGNYRQTSFTPKLIFGAGTNDDVAYTRRSGFVTRVGNLVTIQIEIVLSNKGSDTGTATITALPIAARATSPITQALGMINNLVTYAANYTQRSATITAGGTTLNLIESGNNVASAVLTDADFVNTSTLLIFGTYVTD